jgi:hypothetical protein
LLHIPPTASEVVPFVRKGMNFHKQGNSVGRSPVKIQASLSKFNSTKMIQIVTNMAHLSQLFLMDLGIIYLTIYYDSGK